MQATPQQIYDYVMRKYGDPRLAAEAARRMTPMLQQAQQNPFGRLGRPPEARATPMAPIAPTGLRGFAQDVARSLPVTGEITAAADAVGAYNRGDMVGAGMAAAGAIPMAGGIFRKGGFRNMFRGKPKQDERDPRAYKNPQGVFPSYQARDEFLESMEKRKAREELQQRLGARAAEMRDLRDSLRQMPGESSRTRPPGEQNAADQPTTQLGTPPARPDSQAEISSNPVGPRAKPQTKADRDKARAKAVEMWRENDGQMPEIKVDDLRDILPNLSDGQLKTLVKRLRKEMEKSESPDVLDRMRPVLGSASGILAGPAYV
jgi:hypothetical protein